MASGDDGDDRRVNWFKFWWGPCIPKMRPWRSPSNEPRGEEGEEHVDPTLTQEEQGAPRANKAVMRETMSRDDPPDLGDITLDPFYQRYLAMGTDEKTAREEASRLKLLRERMRERKRTEKKAVEEPAIDVEEDSKRLQKSREDRYRNMVARANQGSSKTKPLASEEPGGRKCSCCGADDLPLSTWSGCGHLICDECMGHHLFQVMTRTVWEVKCKVEKCGFTMTAEECRVFFPDHEDLIDCWIAKIPEAVRNPNPPPAVESQSVENMLDGWMDNMTENPPPDVDEEADLQKAIQLSLEDQMAGPQANEGEGASSSNTKPGGGPECGRCGVDEGRIHTWSRCRHLICDKCMEDHLDYMIEHKVWNVRCRVKGCTETMTAEECRVFLPDNQQDRINDWIASIPEADRAN